MSHDDRNDLDRTLDDLGIATGEGSEGQLPEEDAVMPDVMHAVQVVPDDGDALARTEAFLVQLLLEFDAAYAVDVAWSDDEEITADIHGGDAGRLIGKNGRTLAALDQIVNAVVNRSDDVDVRVNVDVGGYKRRRDERLRQQAQRAADQVRKSGEPVELEPMTAAERRVVHMAVAEMPDVITESTGEGRDRRVVLAPNPS